MSQFVFDLDNRGYLKKRESSDLEYKQNFQLGDNLLKYIKTLVGMANNKGGKIIFGVKDSPHILLGMANNRFSEIDPKEIDAKIREYFAPEIQWSSYIIDNDGKKFGCLSVTEAEEKPIVCKKMKHDVLREGAIYYRYRGETKEVEYPELKRILDEERKKERILWIQHIEKISMVGPRNIHILDNFSGELSQGNSKVLLEKSLLDQIKFVKEGHFTEKEGEGLPTLKLVGTIEGLMDVENVVIDPNLVYPLTTGQMQEELELNNFEIQAVIHHLDLKNKPKRHTVIKQGANSNSIHKYSQSVVDIVKRIFEKEGKQKFITECTNELKKYRSTTMQPKKKRRGKSRVRKIGFTK